VAKINNMTQAKTCQSRLIQQWSMIIRKSINKKYKISARKLTHTPVKQQFNQQMIPVQT